MLLRVCLCVLLCAVAVSAVEYSFPGSWNNNNAADVNAVATKCNGTANSNLWFKHFTGTSGDSFTFKVVINRDFSNTVYGMGAAATTPQQIGKSFVSSSAAGVSAVTVTFPSAAEVYVWFNIANNEIGLSDGAVCVDTTSTLSCSGDVTVFGAASTCTVTPRVNGVAVKGFHSWFNTLTMTPTSAVNASTSVMTNTFTALDTITFPVYASNSTGLLTSVPVTLAFGKPAISTTINRRDTVAFFGNYTGTNGALNDANAAATQCNSPTQLLIYEKQVSGTGAFSFKVTRGASTQWIVGCNAASFSSGFPRNCTGVSTTATNNALWITATFPSANTPLYLIYAAPSTNTGRGFVYVSTTSMCATPDSTSQLVCPTLATPSSTISCSIVPRRNNVALTGAWASFFSPATSTLQSATLNTGAGTVGSLTGSSMSFSYNAPITASTVTVGVALASNTASISTGTNLTLNDFSAHFTSFSVNGDAAVSGTSLRLQHNTTGTGSGAFSSAFLQAKYPLLTGFEAQFTFQIDGRVSGGGEELGFAVQSTGSTVANRAFNGLYLKMDTNNNVNENDPGSNFFALFTSPSNDYNDSLIQDRTAYFNNFEDGNRHVIGFSVTGSSTGVRTWTVKMDNAVKYTGTLSNAAYRAMLDSNGNGFVGFIARKTSVSEIIMVHDFNFTTFDTQAPTFPNCPGTVHASTFDLTKTSMWASWVTPVATDNAIVVFTNSTHKSGDLFNAGSTTVTYTAFDSSGNMGTCSFDVVVAVEVPDCTEFPPYLDTTQTTAQNGNLTIMVISSQSYYSTALQFVAGTSPCASFTPDTWWTPLFYGTCNTFYRFTVDMNSAVANCGFNNDETVSSLTTFRGTIVMTTIKATTPIRNVPLNVTRVTAITLGVEFPTSVTVATTTVSVFGSAIQYAQVQTQNYLPATFTAVIGLLTSMQYPYQLLNPKVDQVPGYYINVTVINPDPYESAASSCNATGVDNWADGGSCTQVWDVLIVPINPCVSTTSLNISNLHVYFDVMCMNVFTGSCTPPATYNTSLAFTASSTDYCPKTIFYNEGNIGLNMSLSTYQDAAYGQAQNQFVFGTRIYLKGIVSSLIAMSDIRFERISLLSGAAEGISNLYLNSFTNASDFFGPTPPIGIYATVPNKGYTVSSESSLTRMTIEEPTTSNSFAKVVTCSWVWSDEISKAAGDNPENTVVQVAVRARFANVSVVGHTHSRLYSFNVPLSKLLADNNVPYSTSSSSVVAVQQSGEIGGSASNSFLGTGVAVEIMAALFALFGVALLTFAAVAVWYNRRNRQMIQVGAGKESVRLDSVSIQTNTSSSDAALSNDA